MKTKKYLAQVAHIVDSDIHDDDGKIYVSNFDNSYITRVGMEKNIKHLAKREITHELTHGVGFSPKHGKWYGWSHRAICGFEVGSTCKKGDCHYNGSTIEEQEAAAIAFWENESRKCVRSDGIAEKDGERFFDIKWTYGCDTNLVPNKKLHGSTTGCLHHIKPLGRGEWVAETMGDAKQMARDFNDGVS